MSDLTTQQMIDKAMDDQQPRLASSARCTEIAESGGIGLLEFYELTGIDSDYSLFKINKRYWIN